MKHLDLLMELIFIICCILYEPKVSKMGISLIKDVKNHPNFYADKGDRPSSPTAKGRSQAHLSAK